MVNKKICFKNKQRVFNLFCAIVTICYYFKCREKPMDGARRFRPVTKEVFWGKPMLGSRRHPDDMMMNKCYISENLLLH